MKLFFLVSRIPWPLEKGDKLRAFHQARLLAKHHEVTLCCLSDQPADEQALSHIRTIVQHVEIVPLSKPGILLHLILGLFSDKPFQVHYFFQWRARRRIRRLIDEVVPDHIYCQLVRTSEYVKHFHAIPKTLDYMDAFNTGHLRRVEKAPLWMRPLLRAESRRLTAYENLIFEYFDHHTIITEQDRQLIYHTDRKNIAVVPNGVDNEYFVPRSDQKDFELVFTGNMAYPPNVDCARYLALEILPRVWKENPRVRLLLAGATPVSEVRELAKDPRIQVTGWVDDIRSSYSRSSVFLAPMLIGTGLQNKLLEAMCMELPCVVSPLVGGATGGKAGEHFLVGNSAEEVAAHAIYLLQNPVEARALAARGRAYVISNFNWENTVNQLENVLGIRSK